MALGISKTPSGDVVLAKLSKQKDPSDESAIVKAIAALDTPDLVAGSASVYRMAHSSIDQAPNDENCMHTMMQYYQTFEHAGKDGQAYLSGFILHWFRYYLGDGWAEGRTFDVFHDLRFINDSKGQPRTIYPWNQALEKAFGNDS